MKIHAPHFVFTGNKGKEGTEILMFKAIITTQDF